MRKTVQKIFWRQTDFHIVCGNVRPWQIRRWAVLIGGRFQEKKFRSKVLEIREKSTGSNTYKFFFPYGDAVSLEDVYG